MNNLTENLTELCDDLFQQTRKIEPHDLLSPAPEVVPPNRHKRRALAALMCAAVVTTGVVVAVHAVDNRSGDLRVATGSGKTNQPATETTVHKPSGAEFLASLPDCVPVDDRQGTPGCVLNSQLNPADGNRVIPDGMPGLPVYDHVGGAVVGYLMPAIGFVERSTADDADALAHLQDCLRQLFAGQLDGSPRLAGCAAALQAYGYPDPVDVAHRAAVAAARHAANPPPTAP